MSFCGSFRWLADTVQECFLKNKRQQSTLHLDVESAPSSSAPPSGPTSHEQDDKIQNSPKATFTIGNQLRHIFGSWLNLLLLAIPIGITINFIPSVSRIVVFVINFIAIIPLAALLGFATEEVALRIGDVLGALINASFGNAVELIVAIIALTQGKTLIVQTSLIGSILSNLLLVLGMCFFFGGVNRKYQYFNTTAAQAATGMLAVALAGVIIPTVFSYNGSTRFADVASISRGTAVILLVAYTAYLWFQLHTHKSALSEAKPTKVDDEEPKSTLIAPGPTFVDETNVNDTEDDRATNGKPGDDNTNELLAPNEGCGRKSKESKAIEDNTKDDNIDNGEPKLHIFVAIGLLALSAIAIAFCAEFMVDSIDAVTSTGVVSTEFVGLILLPIVGNAAEHATAVTLAIKNKVDLAIGVAIGSSIQVALLIIPLLVVVGWGLHEESMTLAFDFFQVGVLFFTVFLVNYLIADGKSHWLEGMLLICLYAIVGVCCWWYPAEAS